MNILALASTAHLIISTNKSSSLQQVITFQNKQAKVNFTVALFVIKIKKKTRLTMRSFALEVASQFECLICTIGSLFQSQKKIFSWSKFSFFYCPPQTALCLCGLESFERSNIFNCTTTTFLKYPNNTVTQLVLDIWEGTKSWNWTCHHGLLLVFHRLESLLMQIHSVWCAKKWSSWHTLYLYEHFFLIIH